MSFDDLLPEDFELVVGALLRKEGYTILKGPSQPGERGADYEVQSPQGTKVLVNARHIKRIQLGSVHLRQFAGDITRLMQLQSATQALLVFSQSLTKSAIDELSNFSDIDVWDRSDILRLLSQNKDVAELIDGLIKSRNFVVQAVKPQFKPLVSDAKQLALELRLVPCGKSDWSQYENLITRILSFLFLPDLAPPEQHKRTDDGLEIMDAIFPIRSTSPPWSLVRSEYGTRFVVAEFKNYCEPIGQRQVESISQYLLEIAKRKFGLLVSRQEPSASALDQRRKEWVANGKMICFLSDSDLEEMLAIRGVDGDPYAIIEAKLEAFLMTLSL